MIRKQCPLPFGGHEELVGGATRTRIAAFWTWVLTTIRLRLQSTRAVLDTLGFDAVTNFENDWLLSKNCWKCWIGGVIGTEVEGDLDQWEARFAFFRTYNCGPKFRISLSQFCFLLYLFEMGTR